MDCCHKPGFLRKTKGTQHFYHQTKHETCAWKEESPEHEWLKYQIYKVCKAEDWRVQTEYRSDDGTWIADVLARKGDKIVVFEVQLSKISFADLEDRDKKYRNQKIESYWILNEFFNQQEIDYYKEILRDRFLLSNMDFVRQNDLVLKCEDIFILKKIKSIGIKSPFKCLYTQDRDGISLDEWIKDVLNGNYQRNLTSRYEKFSKKIDLLKRAISVIEGLAQFNQNSREFSYKLTNYSKFDNIHNAKHELDTALDYLSTMNAILRKIITVENGFSPSSNGNTAFKLISSTQIDIIERSSQEISRYEEQINMLILKIQNTIIHESPIFNKKQSEQSPKQEIRETRYPQVKFRFIDVLPSVVIESSVGHRYFNPSGCCWDIDTRDAKDFEKRGFGKIIN
jgi:hypothetical protein